jgi:hypothetical protein
VKKNRYLLCLLLCGLMLYFAVPRLSIFAAGAEGIFAIVWLSFALVVIAGNLTALLYSPKKRTGSSRQMMQMRKKSRSFH